jgi:hypothetical protein
MKTSALICSLLVISTLSAVPAAPASAQTIWRCGPDGTRFQDRPCGDGAQLAQLAQGAPPPVDAVREAHAVAQRERLALQALAAERRARDREAVARGLGPAGIVPRPEPRVVPAKEKRPPQTPWTTAPLPPKAKAKPAQRPAV